MPLFNQDKKQLSVAIIGTGISGICAAIQLKQKLGIEASIFEKSSDLGGAWYESTFPGLECDAASHLFSFSFEQNPEWTTHYSSQREIHAYLQDVARKYNLYDRIKFNTEVVHAEWKEDQYKWFLQWRNTRDLQKIETGYYDVIVSGMGPLSAPNIPKEFAGFEGPIMHTARWDSSIDFSNKRVAIIGSGASAVQLVPQLQEVAAHVYSYQRTPVWCNYRNQYSYPAIIKWIFRCIPFTMRLYRWYQFVANDTFFVYFAWNRMNELLKRKIIRSTVSRLSAAGRPDLAPLLTPDYPVGCKRLAQSETYIEALTKSNVTLIPTAASNTQGHTVIDKNGNETEVDILVLATGYDLSNPLGNLNVYGRNNVSLYNHWGIHGAKTYKTMTVHRFPNLFLLLGPNSGGGHNSAVTVIEIQVSYAIQCLKHMIRKNIAAIEPKEAAQEAFVAKVHKGLEGSIWRGCKSWYISPNGEIYSLWHSTSIAYWWGLRSPKFRDYIEYLHNQENDM